jgi:protein ImuA
MPGASSASAALPRPLTAARPEGASAGARLADPALLHPALWRAAQLGRAGTAGMATGFASLDAVLPGGGWQAGALTELLLPHPGVGEWRLLAPVLAAVQRGAGPDGIARPVMLFGPPDQPCAWALGALGLDLRQLVLVQRRDLPVPLPRGASAPGALGADMSRRRAAPSLDAPPRGAGAAGALGADMSRRRAAPSLDAPPRGAGAAGALGADILWSLEQALASGQVGAALAWLPARLPPDALRRLQLAAQAHPGPVFLFREVEAGRRPSAAPLRLQLAPDGADVLQVQVLKRRGPPLAGPLRLTLPPVLSPLARERAAARPQPGAGLAAARPAVPGQASRPGGPDRPAPAVA